MNVKPNRFKDLCRPRPSLLVRGKGTPPVPVGRLRRLKGCLPVDPLRLFHPLMCACHICVTAGFTGGFEERAGCMPRRAVSPNIRSARQRASLSPPPMPRGSGSSTRSAPPGPGARRSGRAHRAPCAHRHLPGCPVRSSGPRAPAAPAARKRGDKQSRTVRPDSVRPLPPYHRRGSSQGRNAAARRCLHSAGGDGEKPGPAKCPNYAEKQKMLMAGGVCPVSRPVTWRPRRMLITRDG